MRVSQRMVSKSSRNGSAEELPIPTTKKGWRVAGVRYKVGWDDLKTKAGLLGWDDLKTNAGSLWWDGLKTRAGSLGGGGDDLGTNAGPLGCDDLKPMLGH